LIPGFISGRPVLSVRARVQLGLRPDLLTGLVLFGGVGSHDTVRVVRALNHSDPGIQLIVLCGRHEGSMRALKDMDADIPMHVEGFTREVPHFMSLADFFIGKPGPGSISEALAMHLPVIVECNNRTMVHERYNAQWVREKEVGLVVENFDQIDGAVRELLNPDSYRRLRANAGALQNTAVYDAVEWLAWILEKHGITSAGPSRIEANVNPRLTAA
jgi:processive 1,2-diacylglycerol beta-glucosyltransferase